MKFGLHNPSWLFGADPAEIFPRVTARALWAEQQGFTWFSVMDHMIEIPRYGAPDEPFMEGWAVLSALAAVTSRIRLATLACSVAYRNPAHLAKIAATVDLISRGRLTLGIGAGYFETEYRQYGWNFPPNPAVRIRQMEEAVRLIRALWTEKRTTFHGMYFQAEDAILEPKPLQRPHPPILIAGGGEQVTLRAVARLGQACNVFGTPNEVKRKFDILHRHCEAENRNYGEIERTTSTLLLLARDEAALATKAARLGTEPGADGFAFVGTASKATDWVGQYRDAGAQLFISSAFKNDAETLELLATDIIPHFA
jgi:F420-dependent oxidoreductase-like protein